MTRDEAFKIVNKGKAENSLVVFHAAGFIECLVQLGILKLDEPKDYVVELAKNVNDRLSSLPIDPTYFRYALQYALQDLGLKIVKREGSSAKQ